ncbi:hypothetical protein PGB90_000055 [Kerria lacca]
MSVATWLLIFCLFHVCLAATLPAPPSTYMTRYDYLDIDKILTNERILRRLMDCIMNRGPCTREGKELKPERAQRELTLKKLHKSLTPASYKCIPVLHKQRIKLVHFLGIIPDALQTNCSKCNERQKMNTGRALAYLLHYKPEYWSELLNRFDKDGSIRKKLSIDAEESSENYDANRRTRNIPLRVTKPIRARVTNGKI